MSRQKIDRFLDEHGFAGYLPTSAKTGDGCADLKELIGRHVPWKTLPWASTPRLLAELKNAVLTLTEEGEVRLLRSHELLERLRRALPEDRFGESDARTAVIRAALAHVDEIGCVPESTGSSSRWTSIW